MGMATFEHQGLTLAYDDIQPAGGHERTIVLVHGYASNKLEGWRRTGWYAAFERRRMRCVALDQRGHGESAKPHDPALYARALMAGDVVALLDHLDLGRVDLFGYSMGARTALAAALSAPDRFSNLILGGVGGGLLDEGPSERGELMAGAMLADDPESITQPFLKSFRQVADEQGEDRQALAAHARVQNPKLDPAALAALPVPVLVLAGQRDEGAKTPDILAAAFPDGRDVVIPGCDHFSAIPHKLSKAAVFDFLDGVMDMPAFE
jgi:pimeloyl-ACP methyl ester carboxylesterase